MLPTGTVLWVDETTGNDVKLSSVSWLVDNALDEIEKTNPKLKGILNRISQYQLGNEVLPRLNMRQSNCSIFRNKSLISTLPIATNEKLRLIVSKSGERSLVAIAGK